MTRYEEAPDNLAKDRSNQRRRTQWLGCWRQLEPGQRSRFGSNDGILQRHCDSPGLIPSSEAWLLPGVLIAFARSDPQHCYSAGCVVGVPMTRRNNRKMAW